MSEWKIALDKANCTLKDQNLLRQLKVRSTPNAARVIVNGQEKLAFVSNDYLGLSFHPSLITASYEGAQHFGTGSGASSLISGHTQVHAELEAKLVATQAAFIPNAAASFISTGFMANLAVITAIASLGSVTIFSDELNHASLIDGIRLAKASNKSHNITTRIYPHNDPNALRLLLLSDNNPLKLIVSDGVFSMDGDIANIPELIQLSEKFDALLYIDDAHGFGVLGKQGYGSLEHFNVYSPNLIYMGTLGKAAGVAGAFVAAEKGWIDWLIQKARSIIYSTAPSPCNAFTLIESLEIMASPEGHTRRQHLSALIEYWNTHAMFKRWQTMQSPTAIQPLIIGGNAEVMQVSNSLSEQGIWVPAIRPPTVAIGSARLRIALNTNHQIDDIDLLIKTLQLLEING